MPTVESSYAGVVNEFGEEAVHDRYQTLYEAMTSYLHEQGMDDEVIVQEDLLAYAVMDYFTDISRLKEFERIERANLNKIVSYESFWLLRRKPLQVVEQGPSDDRLLFANESFIAWFMAHAMLDQAIGQHTEEARLPEAYFEFFEHLYYHLKYRPLDPKCLELTMASFEAGAALRLSPAQGGEG